jgi:uncharacterized protein (TIGR00251 family)
VGDVLVSRRGDRVRFSVRVQPRAASAGVGGAHAGALRVRVTAPPAGGAANAALVAVLAEALDIGKGSVHIIAGAGSRVKVIEVEGVEIERVRGLAHG